MSGSTTSNTSSVVRMNAGKGDWALVALDKAADDVTYYQFMGKDNVPSIPCRSRQQSLAQRALEVTDYIKSFNYLNYDGGQFNTSQVAVCSWIRRWISCRRRWRWRLSNAPAAAKAIYLGTVPGWRE